MHRKSTMGLHLPTFGGSGASFASHMSVIDKRGGPVSQNAVERTLGKLATDDEFRARFFENPAAATWEAGLPLSSVELEALSRLSRAAIARFSQSLDDRIRRLGVPGTPSRATPRKQGRGSERSGTEDVT
jgi:putative modified peptide